ncbi:MAG: hypothetical protein J7545_13740 [Roseofilum sp. SBFL]|uniref:hypothetical protein n=1 Tax=unclassified Roseofilum TaxID=2620099 RepID=UPI001B089317|nr:MULTISPECIES: hypothetical protein [unclassified Roseofilum]MBP0014466.1 hypothetical protein [Roseofilum sp. SID3]MBP0024893.1 hypothetical protein [Roseofilum sp. SID2]MBP0038096.1 hypothetical protein [Roseofilum sp. SID1]MBP0043012.1 hypothetical protein [Roseofilum sp. SBFL]
MTVTEIQEAAMKLSTGEFKKLLQWLDEFSESLWDRQIEEDLEAGKLEGLIQQARKEFRDGKYQEI